MGGAAGIDGQTIEAVEEIGVDIFLHEIQEELREGKYHPKPVKRVEIPKGNVISPLLANIYLNYLDIQWEKHGNSSGTLVRYCDDLVVICKNSKTVNHVYNLIKQVLTKLELELNEQKTHIVKRLLQQKEEPERLSTISSFLW